MTEQPSLIQRRIDSLNSAIQHELLTHAHMYHDKIVPKQEVEILLRDNEYSYRIKIIYHDGTISSTTFDISAIDISKLERITVKQYMKLINDSLKSILS